MPAGTPTYPSGGAHMNLTIRVNETVRELWRTGQTSRLEAGLEDYLNVRCAQTGLTMPMLASYYVPEDANPRPVMFIHCIPIYECDFTRGAHDPRQPDIREMIFLRGLCMARQKIEEVFARNAGDGYAMPETPPAARQRTIELG